MVELKWQDPPARRQGRASNYDAIMEQLKRNPGRWALITEQWKGSNAPAAFRQHGFQSTTRRNADGKTWTVYARCPEAKPAAAAAQPMPKAADSAKVREAIQNGTALIPPPAVPPKRTPAALPVKPANDMGLTKFLADRRARGAIDHRE